MSIISRILNIYQVKNRAGGASIREGALIRINLVYIIDYFKIFISAELNLYSLLFQQYYDPEISIIGDEILCGMYFNIPGINLFNQLYFEQTCIHVSILLFSEIFLSLLFETTEINFQLRTTVS